MSICTVRDKIKATYGFDLSGFLCECYTARVFFHLLFGRLFRRGNSALIVIAAAFLCVFDVYSVSCFVLLMRSPPTTVQICRIYTREFLFLAHQVVVEEY